MGGGKAMGGGETFPFPYHLPTPWHSPLPLRHYRIAKQFVEVSHAANKRQEINLIFVCLCLNLLLEQTKSMSPEPSSIAQ